MNPALKQLFLARLTALSPDDPLWRGLQATIAEIQQDSVHASSRAGLSADDRAFNDGRQSMALDILGALDDAWRAAHEPPDSGRDV